MKITDKKLNALFASAAAHPRPIDPEMPAQFEARFLSHWRALRSAGEPFDLLRFLRFGLGFACVVMLLVAAISLRNIRRDRADQITMPNVPINLALSR